MAKTAVRRAWLKACRQGMRPITMVDDLTMQQLGPWMDDFAYGLVAGAKEWNISIVGGEMAQTYADGYVGVVVTVVSV